MAKISMADADKIMAHIGYSRSMSSCDPNTGEVLECYYSNLDIEKFSVLVKVRLEDAAFAFQYHQGLQTMTVPKTGWFSPLTSKRHFMKWFGQFIGDAFWFNKRYADIMDEEHMKKELGDICWYIALACDAFGWDMDEIMQMNIDKLTARYHGGTFNKDYANNKAAGDV